MKTVYAKIKAAFASLGKAVTQGPQYTYIAVGLLILIGLAVGLPLGLTSGCGGFPGDAAAKVGDRVILMETLEQTTEDTAAQYGIDEDLNPDIYAEIRLATLENLIAEAIALESAPGLGVEFTDEELQTEIDTIRDVYFGGDEDSFQEALAQEGLTLAGLEYQIRADYTVQRVGEKVTESIVTASDEQVEAYYEENKDTFLTEETREARHILVAVSNDFERGTSDETEYSDLDWARALSTAAKARLELLSNSSWALVASRYSDDSETKRFGGDLGEVSRGSLEDAFGLAFENELFALDLDEVSELVQTVNGYHIIQVTKLIAPRVMTLEEAWEQCEAEALTEARNDAWKAWLEQAKEEFGVVYREDLRPTTTTLATTTTVIPASTTTTLGSE